MNVLVSTEARFDRTPEGACWVIGPAGYEFWKRYLDEFNEVRIVARVRDASTAPRGGIRADGPNVTLAGLPYYIGPWQYIRERARLRRAIRELLAGNDAIIVRAPGPIGAMLVSGIRESDPSRPYGVEVVGDPYDVFAAGSVRTFLRPVLRWTMPRTLRKQCVGACAVSYVTQNSLQERYSARTGAFVTTYSSIDLPDEAFADAPRRIRRATEAENPLPCQGKGQGEGSVDERHDLPKLLFVGSLEQLYKAPDVLIDAVAIARRSGLDSTLRIIGDGRLRPKLEERVRQQGLADCVQFLGSLAAGDAIRAELDKADLFVLPSRTEGLPRAMIEAMARGVPCIGTNAGGIPELLNASEMVPANDADALAAKMVEVLRDPDRLARLSKEHLDTSSQYHSETLRPRRKALYRNVREVTAQWMNLKAS